MGGGRADGRTDARTERGQGEAARAGPGPGSSEPPQAFHRSIHRSISSSRDTPFLAQVGSGRRAGCTRDLREPAGRGTEFWGVCGSLQAPTRPGSSCAQTFPLTGVQRERVPSASGFWGLLVCDLHEPRSLFSPGCCSQACMHACMQAGRQAEISLSPCGCTPAVTYLVSAKGAGLSRLWLKVGAQCPVPCVRGFLCTGLLTLDSSRQTPRVKEWGPPGRRGCELSTPPPPTSQFLVRFSFLVALYLQVHLTCSGVWHLGHAVT